MKKLILALVLVSLILLVACGPKAPIVKEVRYTCGGVVIGTHYVDGETKVSLAYDRSFYAKGDMRLIIGAEYTFYFYDENWHIGCLIDEIAWRQYQEDLEK